MFVCVCVCVCVCVSFFFEIAVHLDVMMSGGVTFLGGVSVQVLAGNSSLKHVDHNSQTQSVHKVAKEPAKM